MPRPFTPRYEALPLPEQMQLTRRHYWSEEGELPEIGKGCVDAYLTDPDQCSGCAAHGEPDCLCDVDVSKTAGMVFDQAPKELSGVSTPEELLQAGAHVWMLYDVATPYYADQLTQNGHLYAKDEEELAEVVALVRDGVKWKDLKKVHPISAPEFAFLRGALQMSSPFGYGKNRAEQRAGEILTMHKSGMTVPDMRRAFEAQGFPIPDKTLRRFLEVRDMKPNPGVPGPRVRRAAA